MILDLLRSRRSIRRYKPEHPGRERIETLIEAAITAPSASNRQPWRFFAADDRQVIEAMAAAVSLAVERIAAHVEPDFREAFRAYGDYFIRFKDAPVVIVACHREIPTLTHMLDNGTDTGDRERIRDMESTSGFVSASLAIGNLLLYAHEQGLGASCMTGPMVARDELKALLGIPESWRIAAVIPVGFPDEAPAAVARKSAQTVLRWTKNGGEHERRDEP